MIRGCDEHLGDPDPRCEACHWLEDAERGPVNLREPAPLRIADRDLLIPRPDLSATAVTFVPAGQPIPRELAHLVDAGDQAGDETPAAPVGKKRARARA